MNESRTVIGFRFGKVGWDTQGVLVGYKAFDGWADTSVQKCVMGIAFGEKETKGAVIYYSAFTFSHGHRVAQCFELERWSRLCNYITFSPQQPYLFP